MDDAPALAPAIPAEHPDDFDGCGCETLGVHILTVQAAGLRAELSRVTLENTQLLATVADLFDGIDEVLADRDRLEELLDRFAYAVAPVEEIGEHSSGNCPWHNALELLVGGHVSASEPAADSAPVDR